MSTMRSDRIEIITLLEGKNKVLSLDIAIGGRSMNPLP